MTEDLMNPLASSKEDRAAVPTAGRLMALADLEQAWQRQLGPFLDGIKKMTLEIVDEVLSILDACIY